MEAIENLLTRRSIKKYNDKPISEEILDKILEVGLYAPTAMGMQKPIILVIKDKKVREELAKENAAIMGREGVDPFYGAPIVLLVACENYPNAVYDGSCVIDNMLNAAHALGVGSCHCLKRIPSSRSMSRVSGDYVGIGHVALGYYDIEYPTPVPRKPNRIFKI